MKASQPFWRNAHRSLPADSASSSGLIGEDRSGVWVKGLNLGEETVLREVLRAAGLDADRIVTRLEEQEVKDQLRANTEEAVRRGVFGAPTFFVGEEMFWGNDRLPFVEEQLAR